MNPGSPELGPRPVSLGPPCQPGWQLVLPMVPGVGVEEGRVGPSRGTGREARQPSQQARLGWRAQLWIWFSQNTKPPARSLSPGHWGLCQACAHPLRPCQDGGWAGLGPRTVAPAGLSGRRVYSSPEALPSRPCRSIAAQAQRGADTLEKLPCGEPPIPGAPSASSWYRVQALFLV